MLSHYKHYYGDQFVPKDVPQKEFATNATRNSQLSTKIHFRQGVDGHLITVIFLLKNYLIYIGKFWKNITNFVKMTIKEKEVKRWKFGMKTRCFQNRWTTMP